MTTKRYRLWCETEASQVHVWSDTVPTECPNDGGHTIDTNSITIIEKIPDNVFCSLNFQNGTNPYVEVDSDTWTTVARFRYLGSNAFPISKVICTVSRAGTTGTSKYRLRDVSSDDTIAIKEWTTAGEQNKGVSLNNIPTNKANFELQLKQLASDDSAGRIWSCLILNEGGTDA